MGNPVVTCLSPVGWHKFTIGVSMKYRKFQVLVITTEGNIREWDFVVSFRFHGHNCYLISVIDYLKQWLCSILNFQRQKECRQNNKCTNPKVHKIHGQYHQTEHTKHNIREWDFLVSFRFHGHNCYLISVIDYLKQWLFDFEFSTTKRMSSK
jgi:hypothetical protein